MERILASHWVWWPSLVGVPMAWELQHFAGFELPVQQMLGQLAKARFKVNVCYKVEGASFFDRSEIRVLGCSRM